MSPLADSTDFELTLYFFPSPRGIDWSSPRTLARSALRNHVGFGRQRHPIGHVSVELASVGLDGDRVCHFLTGMVAANRRVKQLQVLRGAGLGVLCESVPGRLEDADDVRLQLRRRYRSGKLSFITFQVSASVANRVFQYQEEFRALGLYHSYGLTNRPIHGEGSGCSAYGASFLEVAGLMFPELEAAWTYEVNAPERLIGKGTSGSRVSLLKMLIERNDAWSPAHEPHRRLCFWDPDAMHRWLERSWDEIAAGGRGPGGFETQRAMRGSAKGLRVDARPVEAPTGPIFASGVAAVGRAGARRANG